jgi:hypothetical protein
MRIDRISNQMIGYLEFNIIIEFLRLSHYLFQPRQILGCHKLFYPT